MDNLSHLSHLLSNLSFQAHSVIAKGCKGDKRLSAVDGDVITLDEVTLPWTTKNDKEKEAEPIRGTAHFCTKDDFCNAASSLIPLSLTVFFGTLIVLLHLL